MRSHMEEVAKMFGLELGEVFKVTDDTYGAYQLYHRFTESNGIEISDDGVTWEKAKAIVLKCLLMGDARIIKLPWKPHIGEKFYIPCIHTEPEYMYSSYYWNNDDYDKEYYRMGLICKTSEEAVALTKKMIAMIQEEKKNGQLHD